MPEPVVAIFDVGKTNKKLFLFNQSYQIVFEKSEHLEETVDDDGDSCEDLGKLHNFIQEGLRSVTTMPGFTVRAVNCSAYGASFVYLDEAGRNIGCLYNYLKPFPPSLQKQFYNTYGGEKLFSFQTASPVLGSLNSGMQLYRIKHEKPELFNRINYALHLPQYLAYLVMGKTFSEITSIGCHTNLWHFQNSDYHYWVKREGILEKLPPVAASDMVVQPDGYAYSSGIGLHDSSSALIPYLVSYSEPFALISTGTWAISLNPFNATPLTRQELECDCLCYLQYRGAPVKASRLFAGHHHDEQVERIAVHFNHKKDRYYKMAFQKDVLEKIDRSYDPTVDPKTAVTSLRFSQRDLDGFSSDEDAYHQLVFDLAVQQYFSTRLILRGADVRRIFVDGGFSNNEVYMNLIASLFPDLEVYASSIPQATAIGAALAIHDAWNGHDFPSNTIQLKRYWPHPLA